MLTVPRDVITAVRARPRPVVVAVDGPSAAGKSTFAEELLASTPGDAQVVHVDDFYRPMDPQRRARLSVEQAAELLFDVDRLVEQVLAPLAAGHPARFQVYDWAQDRLTSWAEVAPGGLLVVEGVHAADRRCRALVDVIVFIDADPRVRWERMLQRGHNEPDQLRRWTAAEEEYFQRHQVREAAHWTVVGDCSG